jgi:hypothetical protein
LSVVYDDDAVKGNKEIRRRHFRVKSKMSSDDKVKLATVGIESRKYKEDSVVDAIYQEKRKGFVSSVEVSDIDAFVRKFQLEDMKTEFQGLFDDTDELIDKSMELLKETKRSVGVATDCFSFFDDFSYSNLGIALEILENIIEEVNISRSQYCSSGEFVLKTLSKFNLYILIKPTRPDAQIFFSVLVMKEDMLQKFDLPFKTFHDFGDVYITEFVSLNQHSITHHLYLREKMSLFYAMWMNLHSEYLSKSCFSVSDDCRMHFNTTLLFWLEGKEQTSKEAQLVRYAYMECAMDNDSHFQLL